MIFAAGGHADTAMDLILKMTAGCIIMLGVAVSIAIVTIAVMWGLRYYHYGWEGVLPKGVGKRLLTPWAKSNERENARLDVAHGKRRY